MVFARFVEVRPGELCNGYLLTTTIRQTKCEGYYASLATEFLDTSKIPTGAHGLLNTKMSTPHNDPLVEASVKQITEDRKEGLRFVGSLEDKIWDFELQDTVEVAVTALAVIVSKLEKKHAYQDLLRQARNVMVAASKLSDAIAVEK